MRKYAIFGRLNEYLGDILAENELAALAKAKLEFAYADKAVQVKPGGDLGVDGN
jgi:hypothetical protein